MKRRRPERVPGGRRPASAAMRALRFRAVPVLLAMLAACSAVRVTSDYDRTADFTAYKTFAWLSSNEDPNDELVKHPLLGKRVHAAVDSVLRSKGYRLVEASEQPHFFVTTRAGVEDKMRVYPSGPYLYDPWWGPYDGDISVSYYIQGTLVIDIIDAKDRELVWRGLGTDIVNQYADVDERDARVKEIVDAIRAEFPPP